MKTGSDQGKANDQETGWGRHGGTSTPVRHSIWRFMPGKVTAILAEKSHGGAIRQPGCRTSIPGTQVPRQITAALRPPARCRLSTRQGRQSQASLRSLFRLILLFLLNPVLRSFRALQQATLLEQVREGWLLGDLLGVVSEAVEVFERNGSKRSSPNSGPMSPLPRRRQGVCPPGPDRCRWQCGQDSRLIGRSGLPPRQERQHALRLAVPYPFEIGLSCPLASKSPRRSTAAGPTRSTCSAIPATRSLHPGPLVRRVRLVERHRRSRKQLRLPHPRQ